MVLNDLQFRMYVYQLLINQYLLMLDKDEYWLIDEFYHKHYWLQLLEQDLKEEIFALENKNQ
jgi:hypothetical protein